MGTFGSTSPLASRYVDNLPYDRLVVPAVFQPNQGCLRSEEPSLRKAEDAGQAAALNRHTLSISRLVNRPWSTKTSR